MLHCCITLLIDPFLSCCLLDLFIFSRKNGSYFSQLQILLFTALHSSLCTQISVLFSSNNRSPPPSRLTRSCLCHSTLWRSAVPTLTPSPPQTGCWPHWLSFQKPLIIFHLKQLCLIIQMQMNSAYYWSHLFFKATKFRKKHVSIRCSRYWCYRDKRR